MNRLVEKKLTSWVRMGARRLQRGRPARMHTHSEPVQYYPRGSNQAEWKYRPSGALFRLYYPYGAEHSLNPVNLRVAMEIARAKEKGRFIPPIVLSRKKKGDLLNQGVYEHEIRAKHLTGSHRATANSLLTGRWRKGKNKLGPNPIPTVKYKHLKPSYRTLPKKPRYADLVEFDDEIKEAAEFPDMYSSPGEKPTWQNVLIRRKHRHKYK